MLILLLILVLIAGGEYFFFNSQIYTFKKKLLLLSRQIDVLKNKAIPEKKLDTKVDIVYLPTSYRIGYAKENSHFYLTPIENSPSVYQCARPTKIEIESCAQILDYTWYNVKLYSSDFIMKGWMREADIKFIFDDSINTDTVV